MMKKNKLRQNELNCFNLIKDSFISLNGIKKVFDNSDFSKIKYILSNARQNTNHSNFPDFFFDGGIIEHFEVTASDEIEGKGSQYKYDDANFERENKKRFDQFDNEFANSPICPGNVIPKVIENTFVCFSYESFLKSFKRNIERHLKSLRSSKYVNQVVIFLIEFESANLCVYVNNKFDRFYKLSEDKKLLQYIKENLADVDYIIFNVADAYEVIDLSKIDLMIAEAKENLDIRGGRLTSTSIRLYMDQ